MDQLNPSALSRRQQRRHQRQPSENTRHQEQQEQPQRAVLPEQRDDALSVVMRRFTINPQFKSIHSMRTLATTDKELWRIWKDAIPHMKMKLPQHTHSYLICMFENNVEPDNFIRTEMSIYGNPTPIYTDSWGQPSMFWSDYNNLTQTQQNELKAKIKKDKY